MSKATIVHGRWQSSWHQCSNDCVCQNGIWLVPCTDPMCQIPMGYLLGKKPPNFPVPAKLVDCVSDLGERWSRTLV